MTMGKGLRAVDGLYGENLADLVSDACQAKGLNVTVDAIVNDSASSLLSGAYQSSSSPIALILGTGLNATVDLPVSAISRDKFGDRPAAWHAVAHHVLVNSEMSIYGRKVFPMTHWDHELNEAHSNPDFQPLEYLSSGRYMGEIVRRILLDATRDAGLFGGFVPANFEPYALTTETISTIEGDQSPNLSSALSILNAKHPLPRQRRYTATDLTRVRQIIAYVSSRAAAHVAAGLHALYELKMKHEGGLSRQRDITIACNGSVIEKYPDFLARVQAWLDMLAPPSSSQGRLELMLTGESALVGAAIAVACQSDG